MNATSYRLRFALARLLAELSKRINKAAFNAVARDWF